MEPQQPAARRGRRRHREFVGDGAVHVSPALARKLRDAGLAWTPRLHDLFQIPDRGLDERVFALSDMTIDLEYLADTSTIMFNGAVEWSLDFIYERDVVWLPTEGQVREAIGAALVSLTPRAGGWIVTTEFEGDLETFEAPTAADAYGLALLDLLERYRTHPAG